MDDQSLLLTLQRYLGGKASFDELLGAVDAAQIQSPEELAPFNSELEVLYARGALEFERYSILKNRLDPATRTAADADRLGKPTDVRHAADLRPRIGDSATGREQQLEPGVVIHDRFVLEERLGAGGMGVVFKARDTYRESAQDRDPYVALKFLNSELRGEPLLLMAFEREARKHMTLAHPNILTVHDFINTSGDSLAFLFMELLKGEPLDRLIERHPDGVPIEVALPLIEGAAAALKHAHAQGVIHSDFKPGNVFAVDSTRAKVLDFGIARVISVSASGIKDGTRFDAGILKAMTPEYASPEMILLDPPSESDDVYALACVAYELVTGRHPFGGATSVKAAHEGLKPKRHPGMRGNQYKAIVHGLAFRKADRTPSVHAFLEEFKGRDSDTGITKRKILRAIAITAVLFGIIGLGALWYMQLTPDEDLMRRLEEQATAQVEEASQKPGPATAADPETIAMLLEQGNLLLNEAEERFDSGQLSQNQSSAYGAFGTILRFEVNRAAIDGIVKIVHLYEAEAKRRFDAGDFVAAIELADYGLEIDKDRKSLQDIRSSAQQELLAAPE
jgi:serine/threonine protein kinase